MDDFPQIKQLHDEGKFDEIHKIASISSNLELINEAFMYMSLLGKYELCGQLLDNHKGIYHISLENEYWYAKNRGYLYWIMGDLTNAIPHLERALEIAQLLESDKKISLACTRLGVYYDNIGDFNLATDYIMKALTLQLKDDDKTGEIYSHYMLGYLNQIKGENTKAAEHNIRALKIAEEHSSPRIEGAVRRNYSKIFFENGEFNKAIEYVSRAIEIFHEIGSPIWELAHSYQRMVEYYTKSDMREKASPFLDLLIELISNSEEIRLSKILFFTQGLYHKSADRLFEKSKAESYFKEFLSSPNLRIELHMEAISHLIELYVYEYRAFRNPKVLFEINEYITELKDLAQKLDVHTIRVDVKMLEAKIMVIHGKFEQALEILDEVRVLANDKNLVEDLSQADDLKETVFDDFNLLSNILDENTDLRERVTNNRIDKYIQYILNNVNDLQ